MIVSINQPAYLPWLGYYDRISASDVHVILDHVQFEKNSFTNRNRIKTNHGTTYLTIPVSTKGNFQNLAISNLQIVENQKWRKKHKESIRQSYTKAPYFEEIYDQIAEFYTNDTNSFMSFISMFNSFFLNYLNMLILAHLLKTFLF